MSDVDGHVPDDALVRHFHGGDASGISEEIPGAVGEEGARQV